MEKWWKKERKKKEQESAEAISGLKMKCLILKIDHYNLTIDTYVWYQKN